MKTIEKNSINSFAKFSLKNLKEIFGSGVISYNCTGSGTTVLKCTPFKGTCLKVTIDDVIYYCQMENSLKIANSSIFEMITDGQNIENIQILNT